MATELTQRRAFPDFGEMRSRFDQMLRDMGMSDGLGQAWSPSIDVVRRDGEIVLRADIPGLKPDEVRITVQDGILTVSGEHEERTSEEEQAYVRRERRYGAFSRSMSLPRGVRADEIEATTEDGVLEVRIPMPTEAQADAVEIKPTAKAS